MRRASDICPAGSWATDTALASVTLIFDDRHRRRMKMTDDHGEDFLLDLADTARLADGDGLKLDGGGILRVTAAAEDVVDIKCRSAAATAKIAWHLGNRHTPVQVLESGDLRIRHDHVLVEMVRGLGAETEQRQAPFEPEAGAYAEGGHSHDH